jgi:hypothetical protein
MDANASVYRRSRCVSEEKTTAIVDGAPRIQRLLSSDGVVVLRLSRTSRRARRSSFASTSRSVKTAFVLSRIWTSRAPYFIVPYFNCNGFSFSSLTADACHR